MLFDLQNNRCIIKVTHICDQNDRLVGINALELNSFIRGRRKLQRNASKAFYDRNNASEELIYAIHFNVC